jgi:Methyltransferase domain
MEQQVNLQIREPERADRGTTSPPPQPSNGRRRRLSARSYGSLIKALLFHPRRLLVLDEELEMDPRWGHGKKSHNELYDLIAANRGQYEVQLRRFRDYQPHFRQIDRESQNEAQNTSPVWRNRFLPALDSVALYGFVAQERPRHYFEIGSGNSTMFARRAIEDHCLRTQIVSFDPCPRASIDSICDRTHRIHLEHADLRLFDQLDVGDILFFDGSHYVFTNSDVVVFFTEILPRLRPGVLVQLHDTWLPDDYPAHWHRYWFSEQYMLAAHLLGGSRGTQIVLPNWFCSQDTELRKILSPMWADLGIEDIPTHGASFWMRTISV